jgi:hypothetical protein
LEEHPVFSTRRERADISLGHVVIDTQSSVL